MRVKIKWNRENLEVWGNMINGEFEINNIMWVRDKQRINVTDLLRRNGGSISILCEAELTIAKEKGEN